MMKCKWRTGYVVDSNWRNCAQIKITLKTVSCLSSNKIVEIIVFGFSAPRRTVSARFIVVGLTAGECAFLRDFLLV